MSGRSAIQGVPQVENVLAFRKELRMLPVMAYDDDMGGLPENFAVSFLSQMTRGTGRTCRSTKAAAHLAKTSITSSLLPVV